MAAKVINWHIHYSPPRHNLLATYAIPSFYLVTYLAWNVITQDKKIIK